MWALGEIRHYDEEAVARLVKLLTDERYIPVEATWALGEIGALEGANHLIPLAIRGPDKPNLRETAEFALAKIIGKCDAGEKLDRIRDDIRSIAVEGKNERMRIDRLFRCIAERRNVLGGHGSKFQKSAIMIRPHRHRI